LPCWQLAVKPGALEWNRASAVGIGAQGLVFGQAQDLALASARVKFDFTAEYPQRRGASIAGHVHPEFGAKVDHLAIAALDRETFRPLGYVGDHLAVGKPHLVRSQDLESGR